MKILNYCIFTFSELFSCCLSNVDFRDNTMFDIFSSCNASWSMLLKCVLNFFASKSDFDIEIIFCWENIFDNFIRYLNASTELLRTWWLVYFEAFILIWALRDICTSHLNYACSYLHILGKRNRCICWSKKFFSILIYS